MKKALISPSQPCMNYDDPPVEIGFYVVQVADEEFPVAEPLFWTDCGDEVAAYEYYYKEGNFSVVPEPPPPPAIVVPVIPEPTTQTLEGGA